VGALGQELPQPRFRQRSGIRARDADRVEAVLARDLRELSLDLGRLDQKSRSA
jgi:hypothetical protein